MSRRWRLILAAALFIGWLSYLGYAALMKNRGPVISRAQAAAAKLAIVAEVRDDNGRPSKKVKVVESLAGNCPAVDSEIDVSNLPLATGKSGFVGPGKYLLLLTEQPFLVVGQQRSPGNDLAGAGPPLVYLWSEELRQQFQSIPRPIPPG